MKRKALKTLIGLSVCAAVTCTSIAPAFAEETTETVISAENETEAVTEATEDAAEIETETETETETEAETSDFVEGSAVLADYEYAAGELTEEGWVSEFLNMTYVPAEDSNITMGLDENEAIAEYHERNGEDKQVAINEMVAMDENDGYVQLMVEVNPNNETAEDILTRFQEAEELQLVSTTKETEIAGKTFLTCTGIADSERYMLGVCTDEDGLMIAIRVKYQNTAARTTLLEGFDVLEEAAEDETAVTDDEAETAEDAEDNEVETDSEASEDTETEVETESFVIE